MSTILPNPYNYSHAIRDPNGFFGREDQLCKLLEACDKKQSTFITGLPRIGKTSLLNYLMETSTHQKWKYNLAQYIFILVDMHNFLEKTRDDFFDFVCEQIYTQSQQRLSLLQRVSDRKLEDQFLQLLKDLQKAGFHVVLLFDAFDDTFQNGQFDSYFLSFLVSLARPRWISYITASVKSLYELEANHPAIAGSPFFTVFNNGCALDCFTSIEAEKLIITPASTTSYSFTPGDAQWILEQAGRHPFLLQLTCYYLFDEKAQKTNLEVDLEQVHEHIYQYIIPYFDHLWNSLTIVQQKRYLKHKLFQKYDKLYKFAELNESLLFRRWRREKFKC